eukprot:scaffold409_cov167-Ochromonas_danica.AAC.16
MAILTCQSFKINCLIIACMMIFARKSHPPLQQKSNGLVRGYVVESKEVWFEAEQEVLLKRPPLPSLGNPEQLRTEPGVSPFPDLPPINTDIVILHPDLAHMGGPNYSNRVREMIFFRVRCATPLSTASSSLPLQSWAEVEAAHGEDLWVDLLGLKRVLAGELKSITQLYTADGI